MTGTRPGCKHALLAIDVRERQNPFQDRRRAKTNRPTEMYPENRPNRLKSCHQSRLSKIPLKWLNCLAEIWDFYLFLHSFFPPFFNNSSIFCHLSVQSKTNSISRPMPRGVSWRPWRLVPYIHASGDLWSEFAVIVFPFVEILNDAS